MGCGLQDAPLGIGGFVRLTRISTMRLTWLRVVLRTTTMRTIPTEWCRTTGKPD